MASLADHLDELEDAFVKVTFEEDGRPASPQGSHDRFYNPWIDHGRSIAP